MILSDWIILKLVFQTGWLVWIWVYFSILWVPAHDVCIDQQVFYFPISDTDAFIFLQCIPSASYCFHFLRLLLIQAFRFLRWWRFQGKLYLLLRFHTRLDSFQFLKLFLSFLLLSLRQFILLWLSHWSGYVLVAEGSKDY